MGVMPFPKAWVQSETQTAFSRIWTRVNDSISYGDNRYASRLCVYMYADANSLLVKYVLADNEQDMTQSQFLCGIQLV